MPVSANTVFHYTPRLEFLLNILGNGFYPSYCKESLISENGRRIYAMPMVSFCDIPLSQVKDHMGKYGNYAIGLSIEWAVNNRLNPVLYIQETSHLLQGINGALWFLTQEWHEYLEKEDFEQFWEKGYKGWLTILNSVKPYVGPLTRNGETVDYKFYDEREWRYTPILKIEDTPPYADIFWEEEFEEMKVRFPDKPHFTGYGIGFNINDIKYIIVESESEIPILINEMKKMPSLITQPSDIELLAAKILMKVQIFEDF